MSVIGDISDPSVIQPWRRAVPWTSPGTWTTPGRPGPPLFENRWWHYMININHYDTYVSVMFPRSSDIQFFDYLILFVSTSISVVCAWVYSNIAHSHPASLRNTQSPAASTEFWGPALFSTGRWKIHLTFIRLDIDIFRLPFTWNKWYPDIPIVTPKKWGKVQAC